MAAKTWEQIKEGNRPTSPVRFHQLVSPTLCDVWGQVPVGRGFQYVFCRLPHGHKGLHAGKQDPNTTIGWQ